MAIFRIKFVYKAENQETGALEKVKTEVLAQCVNYTDAEALAIKIIELEEMTKYEPADYEIIRQKFSQCDLELSDKVMDYDENSLVNGLVEHFFRDADSHLYQTKVSITTIDESEEEKNSTVESYVAANSTVDAINYYRKVLANEGHTAVIVKQTKMDPTNAIYLSPETHAQVFNRQIKADEL